LKALELFCCCGGASMGLSQHFDVTGVDIKDNHQYPFEFIHSDVFDLKPEFFQKFDFIWASPPCQSFSWSTKRWRNNGYEYEGDMIQRTRDLLLKTGKPFVMENVVGSPLRKDLVLCGEMFGLNVVRHRIFELHGFTILQPPHIKHKPRLDKTHSAYCGLFGHGGESYHTKLSDWQKAVNIDWITDKKHLSQVVPPAYSKFIAACL
jgi:DNA (cytosine-5)-methyltransferase 1